MLAPNQTASGEKRFAVTRAVEASTARIDPRVTKVRGAATPGKRCNFATPLLPSRIYKMRDRQAARAIRKATRAQFTGPVKK